VFLCQSGLQAQIELTPCHRLGKKIWNALLRGLAFFRRKCHQDLRDSIRDLALVKKARQLLMIDFHGHVDTRLPAPLLDIEYAGLDIGFPFHWLRPKEQGHAIRRLSVQ